MNMTLVEGIGDEVIQFFGFLFVIGLGVLAWWSTSITEIPVLRTVLILERRTQTIPNQRVSQQSGRLDTGQDINQPTLLSADSTGSVGENKSGLPCSANVPLVAREEPSTSETDDQMSDGVHPQCSPNDGTNQPEEVTADSIRIRLKYLNDDQKLVEGRLHEPLGDFKRRHFSLELSAQKLVRLIFNGQVLQRDEVTLAGCGLYDNCVVHCLIHAQQTMGRPPGSGPQGPSLHSSPTPDWNLGGLLYFCLCLTLAFAWVCRYSYSHLFTLTTTTALVGLTGLFAVSVVGLYMPEHQEQTPRL